MSPPIRGPHPSGPFATGGVWTDHACACTIPLSNGLDARAVDQQVQRPGTGLTGNLDKQCLLPPAQSAEIRHRPIEPGHLKKAGDHAGGLAQANPEHSLHRQAGLDRRIREDGLAPTLVRRRG